jgi:hypothetical protein
MHIREVIDDYCGGFWGELGFTIIFGLITILGLVSVFNSHFILSCILLHI